MNYYPFHIGDFRSGTVNMSRISRWIYRDMLDVYYDTEKPLPLDIYVLCDQLGVDSEDEQAIVERLLKFKFVKTDEGYRHEICESVITEYHIKADTARANGKLGGRKRKQSATDQEPTGFKSGSDQEPIGEQSESQSQANQEPITNNQEPIKNIGDPQADAQSQKSKRSELITAKTMLAEMPEITEQLAIDYLAVRKAKRAPLSRTAWDSIKEQILITQQRYGIPPSQSLTVAIQQGWQGFEADWVAKRLGVITNENPRTVAEHRLAVSRSTNNYEQAIDF